MKKYLVPKDQSNARLSISTQNKGKIQIKKGWVETGRCNSLETLAGVLLLIITSWRGGQLSPNTPGSSKDTEHVVPLVSHGARRQEPCISATLSPPPHTAQAEPQLWLSRRPECSRFHTFKTTLPVSHQMHKVKYFNYKLAIVCLDIWCSARFISYTQNFNGRKGSQLPFFPRDASLIISYMLNQKIYSGNTTIILWSRILDSLPKVIN